MATKTKINKRPKTRSPGAGAKSRKNKGKEVPTDDDCPSIIIEPKGSKDSVTNVRDSLKKQKQIFRECLKGIACAKDWYKELRFLVELKRCVIDINKPKELAAEVEELFGIVCVRAQHPVRQMCEIALEILGLLCQLKLHKEHKMVVFLLLDRCVVVRDTMKKKAEISLQQCIRWAPVQEMFDCLMLAAHHKNVSIRRYASNYILEFIETDQPVPVSDNLRKLVLRDLKHHDVTLRRNAVRLNFLLDRMNKRKRLSVVPDHTRHASIETPISRDSIVEEKDDSSSDSSDNDNGTMPIISSAD